MYKSVPGVILYLFVFFISLPGCSSDSDNGGTGNIVACQLDSFNQCGEWINLPDSQVASLQATCVNDDGGVVIEACATEGVIGICEQLNIGPAPDLLGYFYLPQGADPVSYAATKEEQCITNGGVWVAS